MQDDNSRKSPGAAPDSLTERVTANVRRLRMTKGWSQAELAGGLSVALGRSMDPTAITRLERGKRSLSVEELHALADVLSVPVLDLLLDEDDLGGSLRRWSELLRIKESEALVLEQRRQLIEVQMQQLGAVTRVWEGLIAGRSSRSLEPVIAAMNVLVGNSGVMTERLAPHPDVSRPEWSISGDSLKKALLETGIVSEGIIDRAWRDALLSEDEEVKYEVDMGLGAERFGRETAAFAEGVLAQLDALELDEQGRPLD